jgi:hypothetical protein
MDRGADRPQSEGRGHDVLRGIHGQAKTALNTGFVHGTGVSGARSNARFHRLLCHRKRSKPPMVVPQGCPCPATRRTTQTYMSMNTTILTSYGSR